MKHTNSQRGPDGLFARSDGPKAKRIEVWLQPEALSLLDTLCRQWSVGRGKAISHLLCHGPVAPAAWAELEHPAAPTPTPSAPQHPEPRFAIGNVVIRTAGPKQGESFAIAELLWAGDHWRCGAGDGTGVAESVLELAPAAPAEPEPTPSAPVARVSATATSPPCGTKTRKEWAQIIWEGLPDEPFDHGDTLTDDDLNTPAKQTRLYSAKQLQGNHVFMKSGPRAASKAAAGHIRFTFALHVPTGTIWDEGLGVPAAVGRGALEMLRKRDRSKTADEQPAIDWAAVKSGPTPSGRFDFSPYTEPRDAKWEIHQADARAIGIKGVTGDTVRSFKAAHKLPQAQPLSPEALQLFRDEREAQDRSRAGRTRHIEQVLQRLQERATPERISQLAGRFDGTTADVAISGMLLDLKVARVFLLEGLDAVGIRKRSKLVEGVWADLHNLIPSAVEGEQRVLDQWFVLPDDKIAARCMFWGAVIRLASNEGEAPASVEAFLEWCGYAAHQSHAQRKTNRMWDNFSRTMSGKPSTESDRATLGLPPEAELTRKAINDAYKQLAKQHHPDTEGGDADRFQRLVAARERLLLEVG